MYIAENLKDLFEEITCESLVQATGTLGDEVIQITTALRPLEDDDELLVVNEVFEHVNDIFHFGDTTQEIDFQWNFAFGLEENETKLYPLKM